MANLAVQLPEIKRRLGEIEKVISVCNIADAEKAKKLYTEVLDRIADMRTEVAEFYAKAAQSVLSASDKARIVRDVLASERVVKNDIVRQLNELTARVIKLSIKYSETINKIAPVKVALRMFEDHTALQKETVGGLGRIGRILERIESRLERLENSKFWRRVGRWFRGEKTCDR